MKFFNFHLMPYAAADLDAIEKNDQLVGSRVVSAMKWRHHQHDD